MKNVKIQKGSIVKIWHQPKGLEYVVVGEDTDARELYLLKHTCLNNDGTVHKSTNRFHKVLPYSVLGNKRVLKGVTAVNKRSRDLSHWDFSRITTGTNVSVLDANKEFISPLKPMA